MCAKDGWEQDRKGKQIVRSVTKPVFTKVVDLLANREMDLLLW